MTISQNLLRPLRDEGQQIKSYSDEDKQKREQEIERWLQQVDMTLKLSSPGLSQTVEDLKSSERFNGRNVDVVLALVEFAMQVEEGKEKEAHLEGQLAGLDERIRLRVGNTLIRSPIFLFQVGLLVLTMLFAVVGVVRLKNHEVDFQSEIGTAKAAVIAQKADAISMINSNVSDVKEKLSVEVVKAERLSKILESTVENMQRQVDAIKERVDSLGLYVQSKVQSTTSEISERVRQDALSIVKKDLRPFITGLRKAPYDEFEKDRDALGETIAELKSLNETTLANLRRSSDEVEQQVNALKSDITKRGGNPYDGYTNDIDELRRVIQEQLPKNPYPDFEKDVKNLNEKILEEKSALSDRVSEIFNRTLLVVGEANSLVKDIEQNKNEAYRQVESISSDLAELWGNIQELDETVGDLQLDLSRLEEKRVSQNLAKLNVYLDLAKKHLGLVAFAIVIGIIALSLAIFSVVRAR